MVVNVNFTIHMMSCCSAAATVAMASPTVSVSETDGAVPIGVMVTLTEGSEIDLEITLSSEDGTGMY